MAKILIVDDEQHIVRNVTSQLTEAGYEVVQAYDGNEAIEILKGTAVDLVILDLVLLTVGGEEVLRFIRNSPKLADIPVVIYTAMGAPRHHESLGVTTYWSKPFLGSMSAEVSKLLAEREAVPN